MAIEVINSYHNYNQYMAQDAAGRKEKKETSKAAETKLAREVAETDKPQGNSEYLKKLQKQAPYLTLEIGSSLSMAKDKRGGVLAINPTLLKRMQEDPQAEKKFTQTIKDIERAEKTADAYYNALGGCVERTSHWYMDENGEFTHFAYTVRDDKLNKQLRKEAEENADKLIKKTREKSSEKIRELEKRMEEKRKGQKEHEKIELAVPEKVRQILAKKEAFSKNGIVSLDRKEILDLLGAIKEEGAKKNAAKRQTAVGGSLNLQI